MIRKRTNISTSRRLANPLFWWITPKSLHGARKAGLSLTTKGRRAPGEHMSSGCKLQESAYAKAIVTFRSGDYYRLDSA
jgi:hypothetical protein